MVAPSPATLSLSTCAPRVSWNAQSISTSPPGPIGSCGVRPAAVINPSSHIEVSNTTLAILIQLPCSMRSAECQAGAETGPLGLPETVFAEPDPHRESRLA